MAVEGLCGPLVAVGGGGMDANGEILDAIKGLIRKDGSCYVVILPHASAKVRCSGRPTSTQAAATWSPAPPPLPNFA